MVGSDVWILSLDIQGHQTWREGMTGPKQNMPYKRQTWGGIRLDVYRAPIRSFSGVPTWVMWFIQDGRFDQKITSGFL